MRKGKLGVVVCLYPILGFVCVILNQPLLCALIFGFVSPSRQNRQEKG